MKIDVWRVCVVGGAALAVAACEQGAGAAAARAGAALEGGAPKPDILPVMLNKELPFRYPPALYADKTQGNVTLHLYIDKDGLVVVDSTRIVESSNVPTLDSAAVKGARELRFEPAKRQGVAMPVSIMFPVYFRHPEAGDSAAVKDSAGAAKDTASKNTTDASAGSGKAAKALSAEKKKK